MKTCPVCGDVTFDDQPICFGCMHRFDAQDASAASGIDDGSTDEMSWNAGESDVGQLDEQGECDVLPLTSGAPTLPPNWPRLLVEPFSFRVTLVPVAGGDAETTWSCTISPESSDVKPS